VQVRKTHEQKRVDEIATPRTRGGRDSIDHTPGAHDDLANAVAGLAAVAKRGGYDTSLDWVGGPEDFQRQGFIQHVLETGGFYRQRRGL